MSRRRRRRDDVTLSRENRRRDEAEQKPTTAQNTGHPASSILHLRLHLVYCVSSRGSEKLAQSTEIPAFARLHVGAAGSGTILVSLHAAVHAAVTEL
jgi:hypothetical protein